MHTEPIGPGHLLAEASSESVRDLACDQAAASRGAGTVSSTCRIFKQSVRSKIMFMPPQGIRQRSPLTRPQQRSAAGDPAVPGNIQAILNPAKSSLRHFRSVQRSYAPPPKAKGLAFSARPFATELVRSRRRSSGGGYGCGTSSIRCGTSPACSASGISGRGRHPGPSGSPRCWPAAVG